MDHLRTMRCLSLWPPWGTLIAAGYKTIETRSWPTHFRGLLAIHQGLRWGPDQRAFWVKYRTEAARRGLVRLADLPAKPPTGCVVAVAWVIGCRATSDGRGREADWIADLGPLELLAGDYTPGRFGWQLGQVRPLDEPYRLSGRQGMWCPSREDAEEIARRAGLIEEGAAWPGQS